MVKNDLNRKIAIILGVLFIIAILAGIILDTSDADVSMKENQGLIGTPFEFTLAIAVVGMPILMYPILKKYKLSMLLGSLAVHLQYVIGGTFPCITEFFEDQRIMHSFQRNKKSWGDYIKRRQGSVFFARKFDLSAPGTRLVSFFSDVPLVPGEFWLLSNLNFKFSKILSLWFNSTPNLIQMFLNRTETRGAWMKTDIKSLKETYVLDPRTLKREETDELLELFDSISTSSFPSITEQFRTAHFTRRRIDEAILKTVGFDGKETENMLARTYPALFNEVDKLKTLMEG